MTKLKKIKNFNKKFIATCTYSFDGDIFTSRVKFGRKSKFDSYDEAMKAVEADMEEYAELEQQVGFETKAVGMHLEWKDKYADRTASWNISEI